MEEEIFEDLIHFHYIVILALPGTPDFNNFDRGLHEHHNHAFRFSPTCGSKDF